MAHQHLRAPPSQRFSWQRLGTRKDVLAGLLFMTVAIVGLWVSRNYPVGTALRMSTGYVPRLLLWVLLLLGGVIALSGFRAIAEESGAERSGLLRAVILIPAGLVAFALTIERWGLVAACALLIGVGSLAIRGLRPAEAIGTGLVLVLLTWLIFVKALGLPIPIWPEW
jgi:hypothetical protein